MTEQQKARIVELAHRVEESNRDARYYRRNGWNDAIVLEAISESRASSREAFRIAQEGR